MGNKMLFENTHEYFVYINNNYKENVKYHDMNFITILDKNAENINSILDHKVNNVTIMENLDTNELKKKLIELANNFRKMRNNKKLTIFLFVTGYGYKFKHHTKTDIMLFTKHMSCENDATISLYNVIDLFDNLNVCVICDIFIISLQSEIKINSISNTTSAIVAIASTKPSVLYGDKHNGSYFIGTFCQKLKLALSGNKHVTTNDILKCLFETFNSYKIYGNESKLYSHNINKMDYSKLLNKIYNITGQKKLERT